MLLHCEMAGCRLRQLVDAWQRCGKDLGCLLEGGVDFFALERHFRCGGWALELRCRLCRQVNRAN